MAQVSDVELCQNQTASPLSATVPSGFTTMWYTQALGGVGATSAPVPNTSSIGTTTYYVSAINSIGCEGPRTAINVQVNSLPTATISGATSICAGSTATITFNGTPNSTVTYTINNGNNQTIVLNNNGLATLTSAALTQNTTFTLVNVMAAGATACNQLLTDSVLITVNPLVSQNLVFSYNSVCISSGVNPMPILTSNFATGGTFTSNTLSVNATTGSINLATATAGQHQVTYTLSANISSCTAGGTYTTTIDILPTITPVTSFSYDATYCSNAANDLPTLVSGFETGGVFSSTSGLVINSSTGEINIAQSTAGNYTIVYTTLPNSSTCTLAGSSSFTITISDDFDISIDDSCQNETLILQALPVNNSFNPNIVTYVWSDINNNTIGTNSAIFDVDQYLSQNTTVSIPFTINVTVSENGCSSSTSFMVTNDPCKLIPRGISPNGDGDNDTFDLTGFGVKDLIIFNRYGVEVYSFEGNYSNQWAGQANDGNLLPDGTYFYSIVKENGNAITGWVYINK